MKGVDDNVQRVIDYLRDEGLLDNTVICYTGDQGMWLGEHDYIDKRWMYEESMRMPLIVRYPPSIAAGSIEQGAHQQHRLRPDAARFRRREDARQHARPQLPQRAGNRQDAGRLAQGDVLPLLDAPGSPLQPGPFRLADRTTTS